MWCFQKPQLRQQWCVQTRRTAEGHLRLRRDQCAVIFWAVLTCVQEDNWGSGGPPRQNFSSLCGRDPYFFVIIILHQESVKAFNLRPNWRTCVPGSKNPSVGKHWCGEWINLPLLVFVGSLFHFTKLVVFLFYYLTDRRPLLHSCSYCTAIPNPCVSGTHNCHQDAVCSQTGRLAFTCACMDTYTGNGTICHC